MKWKNETLDGTLPTMHRNQPALNSPRFLRNLFPESEDVARCHDSLSKLAPYLKGPVVLTGSIAVGWHLLGNGARREKSRLNDIDIVVEGLHDLDAFISRDFLILHFHPYRERGKILLQLVDEDSRTRIDVFTPASDTLMERLTDCSAGGVACKFVSAEDLLAKLLSIIYRAVRNEPVEPKYVEQFRLLLAVAAPVKVREVWTEYRKEGEPVDFHEAARAVELSLRANPDLLQGEEYCQDTGHTCVWCRESEQFPLAPKARVYEILGYV